MSTGSESGSAAAATAEKVRAVLEAAEQSAAELRAEAAEEVDAQLKRAQAVCERLSTRADEIERALQGLSANIRDELSALKADIEELRAVGEGIGERRAPAAAEPAPREEASPAAESAAEPASPAGESAAEPASPAGQTAAEPASPAGGNHEGARVIALNMALNGSSREDTARYLAENFELEDPEALLDEVYARVES